MSLNQDLYGNDLLKRVNFCNWIRRKMRTDVSFLSRMLFSDEANFANARNVNTHHMHYWANENPRWMRTVPFQHLRSVNCLCGIVGDHIISPYLFEGRFTGHFAWLEWPCVVGRRIPLKIGSNLIEKNTWFHLKNWSWPWRSFSASTDKKNRVVQYDSLLEHWNFCLKHLWIWSIVWMLSLCNTLCVY